MAPPRTRYIWSLRPTPKDREPANLAISRVSVTGVVTIKIFFKQGTICLAPVPQAELVVGFYPSCQRRLISPLVFRPVACPQAALPPLDRGSAPIHTAIAPHSSRVKGAVLRTQAEHRRMPLVRTMLLIKNLMRPFPPRKELSR